jgi:crotonobetainyl-CoA:carnitine CoA-transferase CaiB-like acyl-CoA transferase
VVTTVLGGAEPIGDRSDVVVVELASLWAGPLCGSLLGAAGLSVTKVESTARPDGARRGPPAFFELLNAGKRFVSVDLAQGAGIERLRTLVRSADIVIEGSRPRALEQLGLEAAALVAEDGPRVWISLTGHGRAQPERDWVAFGDDAAVAGGLVVQDEAGPLFCADAIADPISGAVAAGAALEALASGRRVLVDVALSAVAAACAGPTLAVPPDLRAAAPRVRRTVSGGSGR